MPPDTSGMIRKYQIPHMKYGNFYLWTCAGSVVIVYCREMTDRHEQIYYIKRQQIGEYKIGNYSQDPIRFWQSDWDFLSRRRICVVRRFFLFPQRGSLLHLAIQRGTLCGSRRTSCAKFQNMCSTGVYLLTADIFRPTPYSLPLKSWS